MFMRQSIVLFFRNMIYYSRNKRRRFHTFHYNRSALIQLASYNFAYPKKQAQDSNGSMGFKTVATNRNLQMKDDFDLIFVKNTENDGLTNALNKLQLIGYLRSMRGNSADHFLICEGELNLEAVTNILQTYIFLQKRVKWTYKEKEKVRSSNELTEFLKALQKFIPELSVYNVVSAFRFCVDFQLPSDNDLITQMVCRLLSEIQNIPFHLAVSLYHILVFNSYKSENKLISNFESELKKQIETHLMKNVHDFSNSDLMQSIHYINVLSDSLEHWPEEALVSLLDIIFNANNEIWKSRALFYNCYNVIHRLGENKKKYFQEKFFNKLYECLSLNEHANSFCKFMNFYAFHVFIGQAPYNAKLFDDIISSILANKTTIRQMKELALALEVMGHAKFYALDRMKTLVVEKPNTVAESFTFLKSIITLLVDWNSLESKRINWTETKAFIDYLLLLHDVSHWETADRMQYLRLVVSLASIEMFPEKALDFLAKKSLEIHAHSKFAISYLYLSLHQAVTVMHPAYTKPLMSEEQILSVVKTMKDRSGLPEKLRIFSEDVKDHLESMLPGENNVLVNKFTKLGHKINLAIAVDDDGSFFNFDASCNNSDVIFIEDISLDPGYEYVLFLTLLESHYIRNLYSLRSVAKVRVKTLERLGYKTIYILYDKWKSMTNEQKKLFIAQKVKTKKRNSFLNFVKG